MPEAAGDIPLDIKDKEITLTFGTGQDSRRYRVRGLSKNRSFELLKVNLLIARGDGLEMRFYVDTLDLYSAKQRQSYIAPMPRSNCRSRTTSSRPISGAS